LLPDLWRFFREENPFSDHYWVANLTESTDRTESQHRAVNFIERLSRFMWLMLEKNMPFADPATFRNDETTPEGRAWSIRILACLKRLHVIREFARYFSPADAEVLHEIAMRSTLGREHGLDETRPVKNIEEARVAGCPAADLYVHYQFLTRHFRKRKRR
jgi:hypothetical protein